MCGFQAGYTKLKQKNEATFTQLGQDIRELTNQLGHERRRIELLELTAVRLPSPKAKGKNTRGRVVAVGDAKSGAKARAPARVVSISRGKTTNTNHRARKS